MNTSSLRNAPVSSPAAAPAPVATGAPTAADKVPDKGTVHHPFAELLRQSRSESTTTVAKPASPAAPPPQAQPEETDEGAPVAGDASTPIKAGPATKQRVRTTPTPREATAESAVPEPDATAAAHRSAKGVAGAGDNGSSAAATAAAAAAALASRADAAAAARPVAADGTGATGARNLADADAGTATLALAGSDVRADAAEAKRSGIDADAMRADRDDGVRDDSTTVQPSFLAALAESGLAHESVPDASQEPRGDALTAALIAGAAATPSEPASIDATPAQVALASPVDAPEFASALGVQVSLLAHDGVQQAELHLNPAETGPVSIQITLDGSNARVDFGADLATTREAIERGLPELAAALSEAGFTLTGGGVSQHASERRASDDGAPTRGARHLAEVTTAGAAPVASRVTRNVAAGGVDLYA